MLKEIQCIHFNHAKISFHPGLNIILGDDDAKNSIGKSTVLMVIDFVLGGRSLLKDDSGAIRELGQHHYDFSFQFGQASLYFSRATDSPDIVHVCDNNYARYSELSLEDYRSELKRLYELDGLEGSFRSILNPFSRIWRKGGLEPDQPFAAVAKESSAASISRLIDLFERSPDIADERAVLEEQKKRSTLVKNSMSANIIPKITRARYAENAKTITENLGQIDKLKQGLGGAINLYESLFDEDLQEKQQRKNKLHKQRTELQNKIRRLERQIAGITPRLAANIALVAEFFPTVDMLRLEEVETFHQKIGSIVKKELKNELDIAMTEVAATAKEIAEIDFDIQVALHDKGMPDDVFTRVFDLKEMTDRAVEENKHFEQKIKLDEMIRFSKQRLESIYIEIFLDIENKINQKLKAFNRVVYGPSRASSQLRIKSASSYQFTSPADTGTGKSYAGLIGFDLAMISLTKLPLFIHDSMIYKNVEVPAIRRILRILSAINAKQVFLSFDEAKKYGPAVEKLLEKFTVLKLSHNDLLYTKDWRDQK
ncbi:DUF2326 domain-containing protein [Alcaligenes aquatilis]|uniref:DUF2326 domain-containing protein n=1 Tax=Alcaligenes aquatilis TaxID=323284 RepID=UPI000F67CEEA|nr:DUF2326 domain-containing protein [Alcaligenes aquatilis]QXR34718.1 DUF2326 domain-containing protein [Alcaligenes aquatilis]